MLATVLDRLEDMRCSGDVLYRSLEEIECKLKLFQLGKLRKLQVVADFDHTLTKSNISTYRIIEENEKLPKSYREETLRLYYHYREIEQDTQMKNSVKSVHMETWWSTAHQLLVDTRCFFKSDIPGMIECSGVQLREGVPELVRTLEREQVPLTIVSAGIADVLEGILEANGLNLEDSVYVISNRMQFDEDGLLVGWATDPLINTLNKRKKVEEFMDSWAEDHHLRAAKQTNILVLGDHSQDALMASGIASDVQLKVGFLNNNVEERKDTFLEMYDIVLLNDLSMGIVNDLVQMVISASTH